jgi:hypothetical protein
MALHAFVENQHLTFCIVTLLLVVRRMSMAVAGALPVMIWTLLERLELNTAPLEKDSLLRASTGKYSLSNKLIPMTQEQGTCNLTSFAFEFGNEEANHLLTI